MAMKKPCKWTDPCCMRDRDGKCNALAEVDFPDGQCHFRKARKNGPNQYDAKKRLEAKR